VAQAADVVAMAPGTNLGSAHPISLTGTPKRQEAAALREIFKGEAGGHRQLIAPRIGAIAAVQDVPITFEKSGRARRLRVGEVVEVDGEELVGMDGVNPAVISNPTVWAGVAQPLRQGRAERTHYAGGWTFDSAATNSFVTEFKYEG
jgi:hypothetical protein